MKYFYFLLLFFSFFYLTAQDVTIGSQVWMAKNLNVAKFRNGDVIPEAKTKEQWIKAFEAKQPAWCYSKNDPTTASKVGRLYNYYAVIDPRGLTPVGYDIPTVHDWEVLKSFLGENAGQKLKSISGWYQMKNKDGSLYSGSINTNETGFNAFPFNSFYSSSLKDFFCSWWSSTIDTIGISVATAIPEISSGGTRMDIQNSLIDHPFPIRCIKHFEKEISGNEVTIGNQVWMAKNLDVEKFRNGAIIFQAKTDEEWNEALKNSQPAWCYYKFDSLNGAKYGKLYNWFAVIDPRGLAPYGWHIPSKLEWLTLKDQVNINEYNGIKLKSRNGWTGLYNTECCVNGTNESGFSALPGGMKFSSFASLGESGYWWSSTEAEAQTYNQKSYGVRLSSTLSYFSIDPYEQKEYGGHAFSVRCIKH